MIFGTLSAELRKTDRGICNSSFVVMHNVEVTR